MLWPYTEKSVARVLTGVPLNTFKKVVVLITVKTENMAEVSMFNLNLLKQALTVRLKQLGSMVEGLIRTIITTAVPASDDF